MDEMLKLGQKLGMFLQGGEMIELVGDVGAGKTTLVKGIALGLEIDEPIQSPTFTISRLYEARDDIQLAHYDFYRLQDAGIMNDEIHEVLNDPLSVTIVEWAGAVKGILPDDRLTITLSSPSETQRQLIFDAQGEVSRSLMEKLK